MADVLALTWFGPPEAAKTAPRKRVAADWPLIGDIVTHRMEMPEHLIRWRRAESREAGPGD